MNRSLARLPLTQGALFAGVFALSLAALGAYMVYGGCVHPGRPPEAVVRADLKQIASGAALFRLHLGRWPTSLEELRVRPEGSSAWLGPYLDLSPEDALVDPWGNSYHLSTEGRNLVLASWGSDGGPGGAPDQRHVLAPAPDTPDTPPS